MKLGYNHAVLTLPDSLLYESTLNVIESGCKHILVEKPGSLNSWELSHLLKEGKRKEAEIFINY